jgi:hypothetical protein
LKKEDHNNVHVPEESLGICTLAGSCQERGPLCEYHHQQTYRRHEEDKRDLWLKTTYIRNMVAMRRNTNGAKKSAENHRRNLHIGGRKKTPSQISRTILRHSTLTTIPPRNRFSRVTNRGIVFSKGQVTDLYQEVVGPPHVVIVHLIIPFPLAQDHADPV